MRTRARRRSGTLSFYGEIHTSMAAEIGNTFSRKADRFLRKVRYFHAKTPHFSLYHSVGEAIFFINRPRVHNAR